MGTKMTSSSARCAPKHGSEKRFSEKSVVETKAICKFLHLVRF